MPSTLQSSAATRLELKYCEACGALCLRPAGATEVYCPSCERKLPNIKPHSERRDA